MWSHLGPALLIQACLGLALARGDHRGLDELALRAGNARSMFDQFTLEHIDVGEATLRVRHGGDGPPIVLLHGHPRTHVTWHRVAPRWPRAHGGVPGPARLRPVVQAGRRRLQQAGDGRRHPPPDGRAGSRAVRGGRARPRLLRGDAAGTGPSGRRHPPRRAGRRTHRRSPRPGRRPFRRAVVALVLPRPDGEAGRADHQRRPGRPGTAWTRSIRWSARICAPRSWTRRPCTRWSATTARACGPTARSTTRTGRPAGRSAARRCSAGPPATTWTSSTAIRCPSGGIGPTTWFPCRSRAGTTWPRRTRRRSPRRCGISLKR